MSQDVIPPRLMPEEIVQLGIYDCPLCKAQNTLDEGDIGWVRCPMVDNRAICLGCCLDFQGVARSEVFDEHPYRDLFDDAAQLTDKSVDELRLICLRHQEEILRKRAE